MGNPDTFSRYSLTVKTERFAMKLSTKGRHAITAMMELALRHRDGPVTLADISVEQSISVSYLEQLFARLRKSGLVTGLRGPGGGYCLRRPASEISIAQILEAVDDVLPTRREPIPGEEWAQSLVMWNRLSDRMYGFLDDISLADAIDQQRSAPTGTERPAFTPSFQRSAA
jgi:Rrf2 family transcriptional regulator, iron-sulfur cluster assembly transcription factor